MQRTIAGPVRLYRNFSWMQLLILVAPAFPLESQHESQIHTWSNRPCSRPAVSKCSNPPQAERSPGSCPKKRTGISIRSGSMLTEPAAGRARISLDYCRQSSPDVEWGCRPPGLSANLRLPPEVVCEKTAAAFRLASQLWLSEPHSATSRCDLTTAWCSRTSPFILRRSWWNGAARWRASVRTC